MKFRLDRGIFGEAVSWGTRALPNRSTMPILQGVRISAETTGELTLSTFDYEVSAEIRIPAQVDEPGVVLVQGKMLTDIVKALPKQSVEVHLEGSKLHVTCGSSRFQLGIMPVEEYPNLPAMPEVAGTVASDVLAEAIHQVSVAASKDETIPLLTSVQIEIEGDKMTLIATDRYRLAVRELTWQPKDPNVSMTALVRGRTLSEVARSVATGGEVTVALSGEEGGHRLIGFEAGGRRTTSTLIDGDYPKVRRLFPENPPTHVVVATQPLLEAAKRVSLVAERNTPLRITFRGSEAVLEAGAGENAHASETIETTLDGEELVVGFNAEFLKEGLNALGGFDFARLNFVDSVKPVVIAGQESLEGTPDDSYRYLIMPMRIG
ncbi:DNA polymerase III subunit beta [Dermabacteraceae bacterium P13101]|nr:DNA polymerase III subunit beta [Dermabacteraceae bacterium TAE3-ERU5]